MTDPRPDARAIGPREITSGPASSPEVPGGAGKKRPSVDNAAPAKRTGWLIPVAVVIVGMFMSVLDMSIINVAAPAIRAEFGESAENIQWISTSYSLTEGVAVPAAAWLGMRFGLKRVYVWSLTLFAVASALCGLAGDLGQMVVFRILQAVPGGVIPVACLSILFKLVPPEKIGAAMGIFGLGVTAAPGAGPTLGGFLVEYVNWRLIFYINIPIGILGVLAAAAVLPSLPAQPGKRFDVLGFLTIAGSLFSLLLALEEGPDWGWTGYRVLTLFAVSVNLMALFVVIESQAEDPLLDLRVFRHWEFVNSMILTSAISIGLFATLFYIPSFLQSAQGLTAWHAGLTMAPLAVVLMVMMPITGRLFDRFGPRWLAVAGLLINSGGMLMLSQINVDVGRGQVIVGTMVMCGGTGLAMMPIMTGGLSSVPPELSEFASGFSTLSQRVSAAFGLAGMTAMISTQHSQLMADRSALLSASTVRAAGLAGTQSDDPHGLIGVWQQLNNHVLAQTYSNAFLVAGSLTLAGALLAGFLPAGRPGGGAPTATH